MTSRTEAVRSEVEHLTAAWEWVLRLREEDASPEDLAAWLQWYEANPRHQEAFEEMQAFWHEAGRLSEDGADVAQLTRPSVTASSPAPKRRRAVLAWSATSVALAASLLLVFGLGLFPPTQQQPLVQERQLPDGSKVQLAAKSTVAVRYTQHQRLLEMQEGEAFFSVSKDPRRPFIVKVGELQVQAVGTAFNIRHAQPRTVVTVTEGVVEVVNGARKSRASAGQQLAFDAQSGQVAQSAVDAAHALAWQSGRLEYLNEPLASVIADVNRYSKHPVVIADAAAGAILFSGTVFTGEIDTWIRALPRVFPVSLRTESNDTAVLVSRE